MFKLKNDIEKLRAVLTTAAQTNDLIQNLSDFCRSDETDLLLMENFKKMFQFGLNQFNKFVSLLPTATEVYTKLYFVAQTLNGPFREYALNLVDEDKPLWKKAPDILGVNGNVNRSQLATPIWVSPAPPDGSSGQDETVDGQELPVNMNIVTRTKLPKFMRDNIEGITYISGVMSSSSVYGTIYVDQTLPCVDKRSAERGDESTLNQWSPPHGLYMASDVARWQASSSAKRSIERSVQIYNGGLDHELYEFRKFYNPYKDNESEVDRYEVQRKVEYEYYKLDEEAPSEEDVIELRTKTIKTDLYGNTYDSDDAKSWNFVTEDLDEEPVNLQQYTVRGRLGDTERLEDDDQPEYDKTKPSPDQD